MKQLIIAFILTLFICVNSSAQNSQYPYGLTFKTLFMDYQSQNGGSLTDFASYHHGFEVGIHKQLQDNLKLMVPIKAGVVRSHQRELNDCIHKTVYGADVQIQYLFNKPDTKITPYVLAGAGGALEKEGEFNVQIPFGAGLYFHVRDNCYVNWQSEYRYSLAEDRNNLHHGLGFTYLFGSASPKEPKEMKEDNTLDIIDSDGDGLEDDIDLCPQVAGPLDLKGCPDKDDDGIPDYRDDCPSFPGLAIFKGCPDTDGDGISDNDDECPNKAGVKENNGCPDDKMNNNPQKDSDMDGIPDLLDKCPTIKGVESNNGCPEEKKEKVLAPNDSDGDGIPNDQDRCPNLRGNKSANGCPDKDGDGISDFDDKCPSSYGPAAFGGCPDSDGDGIDDSRDKCPSTPGSVAANGCPEISSADLNVLELAMRAVSFDSGKATLKAESSSILSQIAQILKKYPSYNLIIEGHTDNVGSAVNNQLLSERRAQACFTYLRDFGGIDPDRMSHTGYGESRPVTTNDNIQGRKLNRRVAFNLVPR